VTDDLGAQDTDEVTVTVRDLTVPAGDDGDSSNVCFISALSQGLGGQVSPLLGLAAILGLLGIGRGKRS